MSDVFGIGKFITKGGFPARVTRVKPVNGDWFMLGAIEIEPGVWALNRWRLSGDSVMIKPELGDIVRRKLEDRTSGNS